MARRAHQGPHEVLDRGDRGDLPVVLGLGREVGGHRRGPVPDHDLVAAARQAPRHPGPDPAQSHDPDLHRPSPSFAADDDLADRAAHGLFDQLADAGEAGSRVGGMKAQDAPAATLKSSEVAGGLGRHERAERFHASGDR